MQADKYTISCLVVKESDQCYTGIAWDKNIEKACLYSSIRQTETTLEAIWVKYKDAAIRCVIQNKDFDCYDGKEFVYSLSKAKLYTIYEAEDELRRLQVPLT